MSVEQDQAVIDKLVSELYDLISFDDKKEPQIDKLRNLFLENSRMINTDPEISVNMTVDEFIDSFNEARTVGGLKQFEEREIVHRTEIFGRVAHRFSTYEARFDVKSPEPAAVGINSIQFVKTDDGWKISAMCWFNQKESIRIPEKYLKKS